MTKLPLADFTPAVKVQATRVVRLVTDHRRPSSARLTENLRWLYRSDLWFRSNYGIDRATLRLPGFE